MEKLQKPYSENIIFWDTEFTSLNPYEGEILSIGMVKPSGEELYLEIDYNGPMDPWVEKNILPFLTQPKVSRAEAVEKINAFFGDQRPFMVAYVNMFDTIYFYKLLGLKGTNKDFKFHWIQIDFASMLFANGINPERFNMKHPESIVKELGIDGTKYNLHNALDDAKFLREIYLKITT
ncbi:MAG TPA: hypothetical protein VD998_00675 [Verrucomicrobiae bacterium]|nr:hypothetical protein [Verrucomicrobiae bacterium]